MYASSTYKAILLSHWIAPLDEPIPLTLTLATLWLLAAF